MKAGWRFAVALVAALVVAMGTAGSAAAEAQAVETPVGTYHVVIEEPEVDRDGQEHPLVCVGGCLVVTTPTVEGGAIAVYEETNGCEGLQTEPADCDGDGEVENPDEELVAFTV